ncbi:Card1-like endonuclease domain-containing protein [Neisseria leonii]|uniref:Card1-like endonuclease domain-containing protein n=1 Tax=Neisseria leonii TaxID=2995413 RepID=UPI00237B02FE|nr:DUF1887 family CARF protein [Neisseria sp. 3986]MDD9325667.1 DUF1887 family CARF protein [Neisseria sp. 3986]
MKKFDVHVCLVSDQAVPNFVPVLDRDFRPQKVVLLVTDRMKDKAQALAGVMEQRCQVKVSQITITDAYDMGKTGELVFDLLCNENKDKVALNVTGGTKLMAIGAFSVFKEAGYPAFYFTDSSNEVLLLDTHERFKLNPPKIKIEDYLTLYGYPACDKLKRQLAHPEWLPFAEELIRSCDSLAPVLSSLNYEIMQAVQADKHTLRCKMPSHNNITVLRSMIEKSRLAKCTNGYVEFDSKEALQYVAGGWFEDYVFHTAKSLPGVQDIALNVQIENAKDHVFQHNELDVLLMANNVLHVLECKTANFAKREDKAEEALYKLESLKKLGGLKTKAMLLSYRELSSPIRNRAKGAQIGLIEQKDVKGMKTVLEKWMNEHR